MMQVVKIRSSIKLFPIVLQNGRDSVSCQYLQLRIKIDICNNFFQFNKHPNIRNFSMLIERTEIRSKTCYIHNIQRISTSSSKDIQDKLLNKQDKILEIKTKGGNLIIRTTVTDGGKNVENIVIQKDKTSDLQKAIKEPPIIVTASSSDNKNVEVKPELTEKELLAEKNKELAKKRKRVDFALSSLERNFITPNRAMSDFLLKASDLEALPKTKRRSPYEQEAPITVYWRKDVETKAIEIWGSRENLLKECLKRELGKKQLQQNAFTMKRRLRDYRREMGARTNVHDSEILGLRGSSGKVVLTAVAINATNFLFKSFAWFYTGAD